jgi:hypothetical protein
MTGDPQLIEYFAQYPELSFYSVAQVFKSVGFDSVLFVCVSCRGVIKGKARTCARVRDVARGGRGAGGKGARVSRCGKVKAKKSARKF